MAADRKLFYALIDLPLEQRSQHLSKADPEIRFEVERMLEQSADGKILDSPIHAPLPRAPKADESQRGPHKIEAMLGAGGMGTVYRALDTRLGREVALKVVDAGESAAVSSVRREPSPR